MVPASTPLYLPVQHIWPLETCSSNEQSSCLHSTPILFLCFGNSSNLLGSTVIFSLHSFLTPGNHRQYLFAETVREGFLPASFLFSAVELSEKKISNTIGVLSCNTLAMGNMKSCFTGLSFSTFSPCHLISLAPHSQRSDLLGGGTTSSDLLQQGSAASRSSSCLLLYVWTGQMWDRRARRSYISRCG